MQKKKSKYPWYRGEKVQYMCMCNWSGRKKGDRRWVGIKLKKKW